MKKWKLFTRAGLNRALLEGASQLRRLSWLAVAVAAAVVGLQSKAGNLLLAAVWWAVCQVVAFVLTAMSDGDVKEGSQDDGQTGPDTS